ncbi:MAG: hypothetical protein ABIN79_05305 [Marmoricola sp.]
MARVLILDSEAVSALAEKRTGMAERLAPSVVITADTSDLELLVVGFDVKISAV